MKILRPLTIATALLAAACGPRTSRLSSAWQPRTETPPAAASANAAPAASEPPTGDPQLKNGATALGKPPPEIGVNEWIGTDEPITLARLYGRPALVLFCTAYDVACSDARKVLSELHERHAKEGLFVVEVFVDSPSSHTPSWEFWSLLRKRIGDLALSWPAGFGERTAYTALRYGFPSTPAAYLVDADGKLVWSGNPAVHRTLRTAVETIVARAP